MRTSLRIAVPLPILAAHESGTTICLRDHALALVVILAFALGWVVSTVRDRYFR